RPTGQLSDSLLQLARWTQSDTMNKHWLSKHVLSSLSLILSRLLPYLLVDCACTRPRWWWRCRWQSRHWHTLTCLIDTDTDRQTQQCEKSNQTDTLHISLLHLSLAFRHRHRCLSVQTASPNRQLQPYQPLLNS